MPFEAIKLLVCCKVLSIYTVYPVDFFLLKLSTLAKVQNAQTINQVSLKQKYTYTEKTNVVTFMPTSALCTHKDPDPH